MSKHSFGWVPDLPDFRDVTPDSKQTIKTDKISPYAFTRKLKIEGGPKSYTPVGKADLREFCSPIEDQKNLGSCTANAGVGLMEYFERKTNGKHLDASRLFLYKTTRNLLGWQDDTGAFLRSTMSAMRLFGVPPEKYWPYTTLDPEWNEEPPAFLYAFAQNYQTMRYFRLDPPGISSSELLKRIKRYLDYKYPSMFGFTVYDSIDQARATGEIPFPADRDSVDGGHAVCAVGYDDKRVIKNRNGGRSTKGAFLIRNSWGTRWGEDGYGWLPYEYVLQGQADDWWSIFKAEWVDLDTFAL